MPHSIQPNSNFAFLEKDFPFLKKIADLAEYYVYSDPSGALTKMRLFAEKVTGILFGEHFLDFPKDNTFNERLLMLKREGVLDDVKIKDCFYGIKDKGNLAAHDGKGSSDDAISGLLKIWRIAKWLVEVYGEPGNETPATFRKPEKFDPLESLQVLLKDYNNLEKTYEEQVVKLKELASQKKQDELNALKLKAFQASFNILLTEAETRELIDKQLRNAGWEANTKNMTFQNGARPEKGKCKAIAEWPLEGGRADYALFIEEELYGIVEAKKKSRDTLSDMSQAKRYAIDFDERFGGKLLGKWRHYKAPFLFATNGSGYHYMMENRSGTWFLDCRVATNHPKPLHNWFSPQDLKRLFAKDLQQAQQKLENDPLDYLKNPNGLNFRYYQFEALEAIENTVADPENDRALLAMATGTGKTRTILGIIYRLIKAERFNRVLFLVDRTALGSQAADTFKDVVVESLTTFSNIYDIKEIKYITPDIDTKVHFATVQGMHRRIFENPNEGAVPTPGAYDCIVVDEAHRGYNLDREMDEEEVFYKNQADYTSKYRKVLDYFDAFSIGLTATPAPHTISIFGKPVYEYTYNQAVSDGFLIGYEPPYIIRTRLSEEGIKWQKGETIKFYNPVKREITHLEELEDEVVMEVESFNRQVITEPFNRAVLKELVKHISPEGKEKTLIFAANDLHATDLVKWLQEEFEASGVLVNDDAIEKITGKVDKPLDAIKRYKNENLPAIAVTVDLLTTGIDVPKICNLVFLRRIGSRILFEQMLGRATRLCDEINKESFRIFDAVGTWRSMEDFSNMKPVVTLPNANFNDLIQEMAIIEQLDEEVREIARQRQLEQIVAKLHRKSKRLSTQDEEDFKSISGGVSVDEFIRQIRQQQPATAFNYLKSKNYLFAFFDRLKSTGSSFIVSDHLDEHIRTDREYNLSYSAHDYLENFRSYILENRNKMAALDIVCTRPTALDRQSLRELRTQLYLAGFNTLHLKTAWQKEKNEEVAADIIAFIRTLAIGSPLLSQEERIRRAMKKVRVMREWTAVQKQWLERFESQLIAESILHKEDLDRGIFKNEGGGFARLDKVFGHELEQVLGLINENLYQERA
ncbi:MAG: type I restriction-modification system endonuclease [Bacteroidota bacterium]